VFNVECHPTRPSAPLQRGRPIDFRAATGPAGRHNPCRGQCPRSRAPYFPTGLKGLRNLPAAWGLASEQGQSSSKTAGVPLFSIR
jgi:hypothetical protein